MKKIIIDLQGGDNGPDILLNGVFRSALSHPDLQFVLFCTDADSVSKKVSDYTGANAGVESGRFTVVQADDEIKQEEPAQCIFKGRDSSSMAMSLDCLKKDADTVGLLCAGNTGALMLGSIFRLGLQPGYKTPALSTLLPNLKGGMTTMVDCGANIDIDARNLKDFALLGSDFARRMFKNPSPTVALLNVGREEGKGSPLYKEAYGLLKQMGEAGEIHFIGNAEGSDIVTGYADVVVCDGFSGNVVLKLFESVGKAALSVVENSAKKTGETGSESNKESLGKLRELFVLNERGGATFLGCIKPVIKMHGCANEETVEACVDQLLSIV